MSNEPASINYVSGCFATKGEAEICIEVEDDEMTRLADQRGFHGIYYLWKLGYQEIKAP